MRISTFLFALFLGITACQNKSAPAGGHSFYYWKTSMDMDSAAWNLMNRFGGDPLYVRMFDLDYSAGYGEAIPVGEMGSSYAFDARAIIPTVFITKRVFERLDQTKLDSLAGKLVRKLRNKSDEFAENAVRFRFDYSFWNSKTAFDSLANAWSSSHIPEVQIDCDWTVGTKDKYFAFLKSVKKRLKDKTLSCTVRLHQYRDRDKTGVPPVSRVMLMCYNMADPKDAKTANAILDPALVAGYLKAKNYPLPMDIALPLFSWGVWFRDGQFKGLMSGWDEQVFANKTLFNVDGDQHFRLRRDTVIGSDYLREGDLFRLDQADSTALLKTADLLRGVARADARIVIFDWDTNKMKRHETLLKNCFDRF